MTKTLKELLFEHDNNYNFDVRKILQIYKQLNRLISLSIIIPYFESEKTISLLLKHLYRAINKAKNFDKRWKFEVIIIDDGSVKYPAKKIINKDNKENLLIFKNSKNFGRSFTRNIGLQKAHHTLALFMDADIVIDEELLLNHLKIQAYCYNKQKNCMTFSLFRFTDLEDKVLLLDSIKPKDIKINDFRHHCIYHKTWIGCDDDKKFIGREFRVMEETNELKVWPKSRFLGPWVLPNMILGGFFMVNTNQAKNVKEFNNSFGKYGFTETSLITKLVARYQTFVIPILEGGGIHAEDKDVSLAKKERDRLFRIKHKLYFNKFLNLTLKEAINDEIQNRIC